VTGSANASPSWARGWKDWSLSIWPASRPNLQSERIGLPPDRSRLFRSQEDADLHCRSTLPFLNNSPWVIDHPMNRKTFETYIETQLVPALKEGELLLWTICRLTKAKRQYRSSKPGEHGSFICRLILQTPIPLRWLFQSLRPICERFLQEHIRRFGSNSAKSMTCSRQTDAQTISEPLDTSSFIRDTL